jgi:Bacterial mobilisation protein (MobC).
MKQKILTEQISLRVSKAILKKLKCEAKEMGVSNSTYLRKLISNRPVDDISVKKELDRLNFEIGKIGVNINQIAKGYNSHIITESDKKYLIIMVIEINEKLNEIKKFCYSSK